MDTQTFLNEFTRFLEVPNGVQKIRETILELAVRGRLVEQISCEESAKNIIQNLRKQKENHGFKKCKGYPEISSKELLYEIPASWEWVRLIDATYDLGQKTPDKKFSYIDVTSINKEKGVIEDALKTIEASNAPSRARKVVIPGTVIYSTVRPYLLNIAIIEKEYSPEPIASTAFAILQPYDGLLGKYLFYYLRSKPFIGYVEEQMKGLAYPAINDYNFFKGLLPLPPFEEQKRIVEKVDQLMALCDRLEAQQQEKKQLRAIMNTASLQALTKAQAQPDIHQAWKRIKDHFGSLYDTPETIPQLRQTILQLAVHGRLVLQDQNDEPASEIIQKIKREKEQLIKEGKIKKEKRYINFDGLDDLKVQIPNSWSWVKLGEIADIVRGGSPRPAGDLRFYKGSIPFLKVADITRNHGKFVEGYNATIKEAGLSKTRFINRRTVLFSNSGATLGIPAICEFSTAFNDGIAAFVEQSAYVFDEYLYIYLKSLSEWFLVIASRGQGQPNLNTDIIKTTWFALPPTKEQKRIVEKVDQLMAFCDQLESQLKQAEADGSLLLETLIQQLIEGPPASSEATQTSKINVSTLADATKQAAVVTYIVSHLRNDASLGDLKVAKILFLIQEHIDIPLGYQYTKPVKAQLQLQTIDSGAEYQKWAAGPFDKALYTETQPEGERKQWFVTEKRTGGGHRYKLAQKAQEGFEMGKVILQPKMAEIEALMKPLAKLQTDDIEIVATLYAAWKELIQKGSNRNKDSVLKGFYAWSEKKKQYAPGVVEQWLGWMQDYGITPEPISVLTGVTV